VSVPAVMGGNMNFWYYLSTYIMFEIVYTSVMIPYNTLPGFFISIYGQDSPTPFFCTGVAYGAILIVSMILLYTNSWERPSDEVEDESVANVFEGFKKLFMDILSTLKIRTFRRHLGMYLFGFGAEWLFTAAFT
jgi:oligogalacturonide transporter